MTNGRPTHLARRGPAYLVRFRIPVHLRTHLGMADFRRSLHTSDPRTARARCLHATVWFREMMEDLNRMPAPTREQLEKAAERFFRELAQEIDQPRNFDPDHFDDQIAWNVEESKGRSRALEGQLANNVFDGQVVQRATRLVEVAGESLDALSDHDRLFAFQLAARAEREQMQLLIHLLTRPARVFGPGDGIVRAPSVPPANTPLPVDVVPVSGGMLLQQVTETYLKRKEARGLSQSQVDEVGRALGWLKERLGHERPLASIRKDEVRKFRDDVARLDVTLRGRGAPFEHRLTNVPGDQIKSVTALRYWKSVQAFFAWAAAEQHCDQDPSAGLVLEPKKGEVKRSPLPFSEKELRHLFKTPLYAGYKSVSRLSQPGECQVREGHWWSGVLLMHTGLRAGEVSQLLPADFEFSAEIPHIKIRAEDEAGKRVKTTKNEASVRDVPIAPVLLELGFAEFVLRRRKLAPKARVFREFRLGARGRTSDGMTKFWGDYLKKFGLWKEGRATHVWRHTVVACLRANEVPEEDIGAFVGHKRGTVTAGYGGPYPLARKLKTIEQLNYDFDVAAALGGAYDGASHS